MARICAARVVAAVDIVAVVVVAFVAIVDSCHYLERRAREKINQAVNEALHAE